ncbi:MAG: endolytic transglycosylase MltG [Henriciella sp.]
MRLLRWVLALFGIGVAVAAGAALLASSWLSSEMARPGPFAEDTAFKVERGTYFGSLVSELSAAGLIENPTAVKIYARLNGLEAQTKAGSYRFPAGASAAAILETIISGDVSLLRLTVAEGLTTAQILSLIEASDLLVGPLPADQPAEGALLPDTYFFEEGTSRVDFLRLMADAQIELMNAAWPQRSPLALVETPEEAVILASIVEKETGQAGERDLIAGLFNERLRRGMRLESDPTIIYGVSKGMPLLNRQGNRRTLYRSEINRRTDWNTYQIDGLPRTAICNPGRAAIEAVLNPPETDYIFFVADGTGGHKFARTYAEHQQNVRAYRRYERQEIARERAGS